MKTILFSFCLLFFAFSPAQVPKVASGTIKRFANFSSKYVQARNVDVWLPKSYDGKEKYSVLYMHDGQMLFDSTTTWNHQEWQVDETVGQMLDSQEIKNCIVVGIWNNGAYRHAEYFPEKALDYLDKPLKDSILSFSLKNKALAENYLRFITKELKPFIDSSFTTYRDRNHTFIAGSSMGGLISMYAVCEYPQTFGGAACLSTHWVGSTNWKNGEIFAGILAYMHKNLPSLKNHTFYFDYGTETLDALYKPYQLQVDRLFKQRQYGRKEHFDVQEYIGDDHSEKSWAKRFYVPLYFLLNKQAK